MNAHQRRIKHRKYERNFTKAVDKYLSRYCLDRGITREQYELEQSQAIKSFIEQFNKEKGV